MQISSICRILGIFLMLFSLSMVPPIAIAEWYRVGAETAFIDTFFITFLTGALCYLPFRHQKKTLKTRDAFLIVILFWTVLSIFGAIPFVLSPNPHIYFTDALFESISGLTTTGASIFTDIDALPHSIRLYREELHFLGGMGIVVLAVAVLPMLGIGGMQLYYTEAHDPMQDTKLTPRINQTAKTLWLIYIGLISLCIFCYWLAGMNLFDAVGESFSTVSTGGFAMHKGSMAYYHSSTIELICSFFMFASATNFGLHYLAIRNISLKQYWHDTEFRAYLFLWLGLIIVSACMLLTYQIYPNKEAILNSVFTVTSLLTTTGYTNSNFDTWPTFVPILLMFAILIGGCSGSTAGGLKVVRFVLMLKQIAREMRRLIHPQAIYKIKFRQRILNSDVIEAMWGFISVYCLVVIICILLVMATGCNLRTAFGAVASTISNTGAGIGAIGVSYDSLSFFAKWVLIFAMLAGRLEILTLLILFTPGFWKR